MAWAELTSEANTGRRGDASQGLSFKVVRRGKFPKSSFDPNTAGGTSAPTTADRYVRSPNSATDLQYGKTNGCLDGIISGVGDGKALAPLPLIANLRTTKNESNQREPVV